MLTLRGQQHSISTHEQVFLWKCQYFLDRNCLDLRGIMLMMMMMTMTMTMTTATLMMMMFDDDDDIIKITFWSKVNICNVNCARWQPSFSTHEQGFLWKCQIFETENVSTWGGLELPTFGFMPNALTYSAIRARHLLSHVLNTGSGGIDIFEVKLTFEMLTVRGQQHSFSTHERMFLWNWQSFWDRKCLDLTGTRTPNFLIHTECFNLLSDQTFAVPCFEHWLWWYRYFLSKVNICNVNFARATAFNFDTRTGVLVKVSIFFRQKLSRPEGDSNTQPSDSCRIF